MEVIFSCRKKDMRLEIIFTALLICQILIFILWVQTCRLGTADLFKTPMFGVESVQSEGDGRKKGGSRWRKSEISDALQLSRMEVWFIKRGKKRDRWGSVSASPRALPPEAGCISRSDSLFVPPSLRFLSLPLFLTPLGSHTTADPH